MLDINNSINTNIMFENRLYSKKEVAKILKVGLRFIDTLMSKGELEYLKIGDKMIRFNGNYLEEKFNTITTK